MVELALLLIAIPVGLFVICYPVLTIVALATLVIIGQWIWAAGFLVVLVIQSVAGQWLWDSQFIYPPPAKPTRAPPLLKPVEMTPDELVAQRESSCFKLGVGMRRALNYLRV